MKLKILRRGFLLLFLIVMCISNVKKVCAYDKNKAFSATDVSTWNQGDTGFPDTDGVSLNNKITLGTSGKTIHRAGCGYYALSYMLVKTGSLNPSSQSPIDIVKKANSGNNTDSGGWHFNFSNVGIFDSDLECTDKYVDISGMSLGEQKAYVKGKYYDGYFVIICLGSSQTSGHYVFVDGYQGDDIVIGDSGFEGTKWSDNYANTGGYMKYLMLFKSKSGKKPESLPSIYSDVVLNNNESSQNGMTPTEIQTYERLVDEWELNGMPTRHYLGEIQCEVPMPGELSSQEQVTVSDIRERVSDEKEEKWLSLLQIIVSVAGVLSLLYSVLLVMAYAFDKANIVFEISMIKLLTFGKYTIQEKDDLYIGEEKKVDGGLYLSKKAFFLRVLVLFLIGIVLIEKNFVFGLITRFIVWVTSL